MPYKSCFRKVSLLTGNISNEGCLESFGVGLESGVGSGRQLGGAVEIIDGGSGMVQKEGKQNSKA